MPPVPDAPTSTQAIPAAVRELPTGSLFAGRYQVIEELGAGGMGRVYKVFDTKVREKIALKLIQPALEVEAGTIERFRDELKLARRIGHRNVCRMFDLGESQGIHFLTMEYVAGEDLRSMIRMSAGLPVGTVLGVGKQLCDGLAEAHALGIIHRDLKPRNIMIDRGGNVKIMDFGIARSLEEKPGTDLMAMVGTPAYISPEQAEAKDLDHRTDIYSLGVVLYEMATGRVPFQADSPLSILQKHRTEMPEDPRHLNPTLPEDLAKLILRCLEKERARRFQSAADVRSEMARIEGKIPAAERLVPEQKPLTSREFTVRFSVKRLIIPAAALAVVAAALIIIHPWRTSRTGLPAVRGRRSLAVLPFTDLSPKKEYDYLCEGIPETLIVALTQVKGLRVPARTSAFSFRDAGEDLGMIGQKLGVDSVLRGSVQISGDRLRITPQLINVHDGSYLWSKSYDRRLEDVFAIQDEIAGEIVKALKISLLGEKETPLVKSYTEDPQAYAFYLKGRYFWNKRTPEDLRKAIELFQQAVALDPTYALAYVGLADARLMLALYAGSPAGTAISSARAAVSEALALDPGLAEAYASMGVILELDGWRWEEAYKEFRRAIEINPNYAMAHHWYAIALAPTGRLDEAIAESRKAIDLDPLSLYMRATLGNGFYFRGENDRAVKEYLGVIEMDPAYADAYTWLGESYQAMGRMKDAVLALEKARDLSPGYSRAIGRLGLAYGLTGNRGRASKVLAELKGMSGTGTAVHYGLALVYLGLGDKEKALEELESSCADMEIELRPLKVDPVWRGLQAEPRVRALLKRMNLI